MTASPEKLASLMTEQRNPRSNDIDRMSTHEILDLIHREDLYAYNAVEPALPQIEQAVEHIVQAFRNQGRLIYVGAGTSGRLGVLDASECPPTFGVDREMVQGIIAGGWDALRRSIEHAEDFPEVGAKEIQKLGVGENDVVCGIAASSTTPFVLGALAEAHQLGAKTIFLTCNHDVEKRPEFDVIIQLIVGPELITGSTRMKCGTATKMVLNMLTSTAMIRIGKVYQNLMVDLNATCNKLDQRARRIILTLTDLNLQQTDQLLQNANGRVKTALVMHFCQLSRDQAEALIAQKEGRIQDIIPRK
ncbi:MAG: N-acetylmuramic acid 6-phosphate etherase [Candidatus Omnitrophica bacterium]|nr:N-acetylmuramic acid 6-phosphate etherase [Candidatus Omnitrophota bacterium]